MSDKAELRWENPANIYVPKHLNNRVMNSAYIEELEGSMRKEGFLPTYPIVCFRRLEIDYFDDFTSELLICACGAHRTTAAQNIGLERVYVEMRSGTMDDFIEVMHTDNFQFDPALDPSLGQLFTKTEKREACKQLLLLPKFLKLTNVALADLWHTSEANVRRWRDELASSIGEAPDRFRFEHFPEGRLSEIQEILASSVRENSDGSIVPIRQKSTKSKWDFYWDIHRKVDAMDDLDWNLEVYPYCLAIYGTDEPSQMSMKQLSELDMKISERDKDFLEACRTFGVDQRRLVEARDNYSKAYSNCKEAFNDYLRAMDLYRDSYSDEYKACLKSFGRVVSRNFGHNLLASRIYTDKANKYERETHELQQLQRHIEKDAEYVHEWASKYNKRRMKLRKKLEAELLEAQHKMLHAAKEKYPSIDLYKFVLAVDSDSSWLDMGTTPAFVMKVSDIPEGKDDKHIEYIRDHYVEITEQVEAGEEWVERLAKITSEANENSETVADTLGDKGEVTSLTIGWVSRDSDIENPIGVVTFNDRCEDEYKRPNYDRPISDIPEHLLGQLLKIARKES